MADFLEMKLISVDAALVDNLLNQGIDSRLEGFTRSTFEWHEFWPAGWKMKSHNLGPRLVCHIHPAEMQILIRRLLEMGSEEADLLADDIVQAWYLQED